MNGSLKSLVKFIRENDGVDDKRRLCRMVFEKFSLTKDRSVFYCAEFAIRFSSANSSSFSNTVLSLSNLKKEFHNLKLKTLWAIIRKFSRAIIPRPM